MELSEYEKLQMISLIYTAQEIANAEGLNVKYITVPQMRDLIPLLKKYEGTETTEQIRSLAKIASTLHEELTKG